MYTVYILLCKDNSLYTGIARDIQKRLAAHRKGTGAKYIRAHRPVRIVHTERKRTRASAQRREYIIKQMTHKEKLALIA